MISRFAKSFFVVIIILLFFTTIAMVHPPARSYVDPWTGKALSAYAGLRGTNRNQAFNAPIHPGVGSEIPIKGAEGGVIMGKLGNATAKAILGRSTWKLLHTMTLRYPEKPTQDERDALNSYFHLLSRLYPCGECAAEFQMLLKKFPPQTSSRRSAALWLCFVHNQVNERLKKPEFDCAHLDAEYDCGCGDAPVGTSKLLSMTTKVNDPMDLERDPTKDQVTNLELINGGR
ncbi:hypothetical protein HGRIS_001931 [Hohenbuehelia grisea]|uniref:Sulfhydryl oxidase n=1 Tax=Hohenbuehelia grisea TaxID=104357 RepID=A0ABR3JJ06_9AGAR